MSLIFTRVLRTPHSERFILKSPTEDAACLELHYLPTGNVSGTLIIFEGGSLDSTSVEHLLQLIDEHLLPEVSITDRTLTFTVVIGRVVGSFVPDVNRTIQGGPGGIQPNRKAEL